MKTIALFLAGFITGVLTLAALAGSRPLGGWKVQPQMIHPDPIVDTRTCYIGTDGQLHLMPLYWESW